MIDLTDSRTIRQICKQYGFSFQKGLGQNFLTNPRVLDDMLAASGIDGESVVLEIGPGFGTLTQRLCAAAGRVVCLELDARLFPVLRETLSGFSNYQLVQQDALKADFASLFSKAEMRRGLNVAANLPYYISTPILMKLVEQRTLFRKITVMLQKEVALRVAASPGTKDYGALSVAVQYGCDAAVALQVPKEDFLPAPKVDSAVVTITPREKPRVQGVSEEAFFRVVKAAFAQRRKTLVNALFNSGAFQMEKAEIGQLVSEVCGDENSRGEALSIEMFGEIAKKIF